MIRWFRRRRVRPMSCAEVGELLQHFLDGELDDERRARISHHLEDCVRCGLELDVYERIKTSLAIRGLTDADDPSLARLRAFAHRLVQDDGLSPT